jgi:hypothetical protein
MVRSAATYRHRHRCPSPARRCPRRSSLQFVTSSWETLADWAVICDDIICSSDVAALKADDPQAFFGPWLGRHGLRFPDAVLIDDRADNCAAFTTCGGAAIQWNIGAHDIGEIKGRLRLDRRWGQPLACRAPARFRAPGPPVVGEGPRRIDAARGRRRRRADPRRRRGDRPPSGRADGLHLPGGGRRAVRLPGPRLPGVKR